MTQSRLFITHLQRSLSSQKGIETMREFVLKVAQEGFVEFDETTDYEKVRPVAQRALEKIGISEKEASDMCEIAHFNSKKIDEAEKKVQVAETKRQASITPDMRAAAYQNIFEQSKSIVKGNSYIEDNAGVLYRWNGLCYEVARQENMIDSLCSDMGAFNALPSKTRQEYLTAMYICARAEFQEVDKRRENQPLVIFPGLVVNIETGEEWKPTPKDFILNCSSMFPVEGDCQRVMDMLASWTNGDLLFDIIAYSYVNGNPLKLILFCHGPPNGGKSTFSRFIRLLLGDISVGSANLKLLSDASQRFELAALRGKLAVFCSETDGRGIYKTSILKSLSGNDSIRAEYKGVNGIQSFFFHGKLFVLTNDIPQLDDTADKAFMGRVALVPFLGSFPTDAPDPISQFTTEELQAFAFKILQRVREWAKNRRIEIRGIGQFDERITKYATNADPLGAFIREKCDTSDSEVTTPCWQFRDAFTTWQQERAMKLWDERRVGAAMAAREFQKIRRGTNERVWEYKGISIHVQVRPDVHTLPIYSYIRENEIKVPRPLDVLGRNELISSHQPLAFDGMQKVNPHLSEQKLTEAIKFAKERGDLIEMPSGYYRSTNPPRIESNEVLQ